MIVERDFPDHPKTVKLCRLLGDPGAPLLVLRIWAHCEQRRTDQLPHDPEDVAAICRWAGSAKKLVSALITCRWLDDAEDAYVAHGWRERNASWLAKIEGGKKRAANAARNAAGQLSVPSSQSSRQHADQLAGAKLDQQPTNSRNSAGSSVGAVEWSRVECPPIVPKGTGASELATRSEATSPFPNPDSGEKEKGAGPEATWLRCCAIFGRKKTAPSALIMHTLADLTGAGMLPDDQDWLMLEAFYRTALRDQLSREKLHPRISAEALAANLPGELDKARLWAADHGFSTQKDAPLIDVVRLRTWFAAQWPEKPLPSGLEDLPDYLRAEAQEACSTEPITP